MRHHAPHRAAEQRIAPRCPRTCDCRVKKARDSIASHVTERQDYAVGNVRNRQRGRFQRSRDPRLEQTLPAEPDHCQVP